MPKVFSDSRMTDTTAINRLLTALRAKRYYQNRFAQQVETLYPQSSGADHLGTRLFVQELLALMPEDVRQKALGALTRKLVNEWAECPTVSEFRQEAAAVTLAATGETFASLFERAKLFVAAPPTNQAVADRWLEKVIWSSVRLLTRERFVVATPTDWAKAVTRVILRDDVKLVAYAVSGVTAPVPTIRRDYTSLLNRHG